MFRGNKKSISIVACLGVILLGALVVKLLWANSAQASDRSTKTKAKLVVNKSSGSMNKAVVPQTTSTLPPIPPPFITTISEGKRKITIRNLRRDPIQIVAEIEVAENAYGNGTMKFANVSGKRIAAFRGEFGIITDSGDLVKDGWTFSFSSVFTEEGEKWEIPVAGPIRPIVDSPRKLARITVSITGVVYDDRSYWGPEGLTVLQKTSLKAKNRRLLAEKISNESLQMSNEEILAEFSRPAPTSVIQGEWNTGRFDLDPFSYSFFRTRLIDSANLLKPAFRQTLNDIIENCKKME